MWAYLILVVSVSSLPQTNFQPNRKIFVRDDVNNDEVLGDDVFTIDEVAENELEGRVPSEEIPVIAIEENVENNENCCCIPASEQCQNAVAEAELDLVGLGLINPRIVNRPTSSSSTSSIDGSSSCPTGYQLCCSEVDMSILGRSACLAPTKNTVESWEQGCNETPVYGETITGAKECGTREFSSLTSSVGFGETAPGEFPWSCLILNQNNEFIGSCALIPNDDSNKNENGVRKVITAAHKLNDVQETDVLKVRVGEYDASGFNAPEEIVHEEYTVSKILRHPSFHQGRLSNDIALLFVDRPINLNHPYVNTACLPSCDQQFDFQFSNGSGVRCWVAGWGKDEYDGTFQFLQRKVDVPLVSSVQCNADLKLALEERSSGLGEQFSLHPSELCAGGEVGKDACTGDGGSPLVCQASSGRWTVVGLVTWGVGCADKIPGVYVKVSQYRDWIARNNPDLAPNEVAVEVNVNVEERRIGTEDGAVRFV